MLNLVYNEKVEKLGITLFEEQLVRVYLNSDNGDLFKKLSNSFSIKIFTSIDLQKKIEKILIDLNLNFCEVQSLPTLNESRLARFFGFFLRWNLPDTGTRLAMSFSKKKGILNRVIFIARYLSWRTSFIFKFLIPLFRYFYGIAVFRSLGSLQSGIKMDKLDILFATSITNLCQDIPLCVLTKKNGGKIIGTVRSWDNLSIHGLLRWIPDKVLSQSPYMTQNLLVNQRVKGAIVEELGTPAYREEFIPNKLEKKLKRRVIYACSGIRNNPDEKNFLNLLIEFFAQNEYPVEMYLLQHPNSPHLYLDEITAGTNIQTITFEYLKTSLHEYYKFLSSADLVLCAGTTVALDALFCEVEVKTIGFELEKVDYWHSSLRSFDTRPHTRDLFTRYEIPMINNFHQLLNEILGKNIVTDSLTREHYEHFLGQKNQEFVDRFIREFKHC